MASGFISCVCLGRVMGSVGLPSILDFVLQHVRQSSQDVASNQIELDSCRATWQVMRADKSSHGCPQPAVLLSFCPLLQIYFFLEDLVFFFVDFIQ